MKTLATELRLNVVAHAVSLHAACISFTLAVQGFSPLQLLLL
jgi:hypothetical protein